MRTHQDPSTRASEVQPSAESLSNLAMAVVVGAVVALAVLSTGCSEYAPPPRQVVRAVAGMEPATIGPAEVRP